MRPSLPLAALALLAAAACGDSTPNDPVAPSLIINGQPTGGAYGNVGAMLLDFDFDGKVSGGDQWCTGSLISPTVFLTAGHCTADIPLYAPGAPVYVSFAPDLYAKGAKFIKATGYETDPDYGTAPANLQGTGHDLAVVFLPASATKGMTSLQLPPAGYLDQLQAQGGLSGQLFVNVGYGTSANHSGIPILGYDGKRNYSQSLYMGLNSQWLGLNMNTAATGLGGDCYGDSGGPKFLDGNTTMIVATVTTGDYWCRATSWDYRLDTREARSFLGHFVALP
ncbi:MAG TPA: trypsin-like serine protease [Gemmatimonadaceae bacterium]|nr:trypsin-like serine protease [Gemmatimonadaceae bacterium]